MLLIFAEFNNDYVSHCWIKPRPLLELQAGFFRLPSVQQYIG